MRVGGNDVLNGGSGNDSLSGGNGKDTFVFDSALNASTNCDSIHNFCAADDTIRLDATIFTSLALCGVLPADYFSSSSTGIASDSNDFILYNTTTGALCYDADGSGAKAALQFVKLAGVPTIHADDFMVVA